MHIDEVLREVELVRRAGPSVEIAGVEYDSRKVKSGSLFVAMQGGTTDGNRYISAAVERGAGAIVTDSAMAFQDAAKKYPQIALVEIAHGRKALAELSGNFFEHPDQKLTLSGVTGTNGKTTTAFLLDAMLKSVHRRTVLIGTIEYHIADVVVDSPHTTPESRDLLELFARGWCLGATEAVMEVSSHALQQGRAWSMPFDVAIFTNLTRDHLDYHGTMEDYFAAKQMLFDGTNGVVPRVSVINADDGYGTKLITQARESGSEIFSYGMDAGEFRAENVQMSAAGMRFTLATPHGTALLKTRLTGKVNVYNLLAASAAAFARGLSLEQVASGASSLLCVPGRFQTVDAGQSFTVVVDYAHTDDALRNLITLAREFVKPGNGRVITLFGCGGDRDRAKRPLMGRAAGEGSDFVVLTSDNPRSEEPEAILRDILPGLESTHVAFTVEADRASAIQLAIQEARPNDIVLLAGKGHEKTQTLRDRVIPFDDVAVAETAIRAQASTGAKP
ncbi:MAG TPA: UDP-N-acetylmuramoyl-L-alanyl-D-glutamate--2,6-diaminopimelate ligase [Alloacidobacterium sp.]|nr:UDP-N-acetylmuramoyl-L-alanyl-D-glutamate--2,6-diaminopimelate ligase [Alloacidobacterium sp.]